MKELASQSLAQHRFLLLLFGIFAGLALILGSVGVYGVLSYLTGERVPEIGVRVAIGATTGEIVHLVMKQSFGMVFTGIAVGLAGAIAAESILNSLIQGMQSIHAWTLLTAISTLTATALFAAFVPARRASRMDAMRALRRD